MIKTFHSSLPNLQREVCLDPSNFDGGLIIPQITIIYNKASGYSYTFLRVDDNGNYCYELAPAQIGANKRKKRPTSTAPCPEICIIGTDNIPPYGTTPPCTGAIQELLEGAVPSPYENELIAQGGTAPHTFSIIAGALPTGVTINPADGFLSGTTTEAGTFTFTVQAVDSNGCIGTQEFFINVVGA